MSAPKNHSALFALVATLVMFTIAGASALAVLSIKENLRFLSAVGQVLKLVDQVRQTAATQSQFGQAVGEDLWQAMQNAGRIPTNAAPVNPWGGTLRSVTFSTTSLRIESEVPTHECRRMAHYFVDHQPNEIELTAIEAQPAFQSHWTPIYPTPDTAGDRDFLDAGCGDGTRARLALIFRFR